MVVGRIGLSGHSALLRVGMERKTDTEHAIIPYLSLVGTTALELHESKEYANYLPVQVRQTELCRSACTSTGSFCYSSLLFLPAFLTQYTVNGMSGVSGLSAVQHVKGAPRVGVGRLKLMLFMVEMNVKETILKAWSAMNKTAPVSHCTFLAVGYALTCYLLQTLFAYN